VSSATLSQTDSSTPAYKRAAAGAVANGSPVSVASPRQRGALNQGYEGRFGTSTLLQQQKEQARGSATPRSMRKSGLSSFTDPANPFARNRSKQVIKIESLRTDLDRAGRPTRNPGVMAYEADSGDRLREDDAKSAPLRFGYTSQAYKPTKRNCECGVRPPRSSEGVAAALTSSGQSALENYLNDMKRCSASLRKVRCAPSNDLQRMNDERVLLPAQMPQRRGRSLSCESRRNEESGNEENYGFSRKRSVSARWTGRTSNSDLLHHDEGGRQLSLSRFERVHSPCNARFEEIVAHLKEARPVDTA